MSYASIIQTFAAAEQLQERQKTLYSRICLIRHLKGIRKKWRIRRSDDFANRWKLYHRSSYSLS